MQTGSALILAGVAGSLHLKPTFSRIACGSLIPNSDCHSDMLREKFLGSRPVIAIQQVPESARHRQPPSWALENHGEEMIYHTLYVGSVIWRK